MYPFVINTAVDVKKAVLDDFMIPTLRLIKPIVELPIDDLGLIKISVINDNTFF